MESPVTMPTVDLSSLPVELDFEHRLAEANSERYTPKCEPTTGSRRDQLQKLSSNPIFHDLQMSVTPKTAYHQPCWRLPATLPHYQLPSE